MPKKKLTKAQVKRKLKTSHTIIYDLLLDKLGYGTGPRGARMGASLVPLSKNKLLELLDVIQRAQRRVE